MACRYAGIDWATEKHDVHVADEAEHMLSSLPLLLREQLPDTKTVRPRLAALAARNRRRRYDQPTTLRLKLLDDDQARIAKLDAEDKQVTAELTDSWRAPRQASSLTPSTSNQEVATRRTA